MKTTWFGFPANARRASCYIILLALTTGFQARGQEQSGQVLLKTLLRELEGRFGVVFSYADENLDGIYVDRPDSLPDIDRYLQYLTETTTLHFEKLDDRFVTVSKPSARIFCGYLVDSDSGSPVASATIRQQRAFAVSDDQGYFELRLEGPKNRLLIQHIGYFSLSLEVPASSTRDCLSIGLSPKPVELKEVFVSNYLVRGVDKKLNGSLEVKTGELQVLPGLSEPDVLYTMQALPGIQSPNESVSDINIRGGSNDQSLILWDGIKMYQSGHFYGLITAFNPYFTERVELTKNGTRAAMGEGVSGTLDIRPDDDVATDLSAGAGINLLSADGYLKIPVSKKASVSLAARRSLADFVRTPTYDNYFERAFRNSDVTRPSPGDTLVQSDEDFYFYDLGLKANYQPSGQDKVSFSFLRIFNDLEYQETARTNGAVESRVSGLTQQSLASGLMYSRQWTSTLTTSIQVPVSWYGLHGVNHDIENNQRLVQENQVLDLGVKVIASYTIAPAVDISAGLQLNETGVANLDELNNPAFRRFVRDVLRSQAAFAEADFATPDEDTNIRLGLRLNSYPSLGRTVAEPRLAIRHNLTEYIALEVQGEAKNQYTTQIIDLQNDFLGVEKRRWVLANERDIPLVQSKQLSAGLLYHRQTWLVNLEAYYKAVEGIITSSQGFQNQFEYLRSAGEYDIAGVDLLARKDVDMFSFWLSYALGNNNYAFPFLSVRSFPNNLDIRHNATVGSSYVTEKIQLSSSISMHTGRPFTNINADNPVVAGLLSYEPPNSSRLPGYLRIDFSGRYHFQIRQATRCQVGFSVWNLSGRKNILGTYFRNDDADRPTELSQLGLDFTFNTMLRVYF